MGNIVRIGDSVSCGDHAAEGSSNVFANGMPISTEGFKRTTGHSGFPPTVFIGPWSKTVFVNDKPVVLKGLTKIQVHRKSKSSHDGIASSGAPTVSIEK